MATESLDKGWMGDFDKVKGKLLWLPGDGVQL